MRSLCKVCEYREFRTLELESIKVGGKQWCKKYNMPITEIKTCWWYKRKQDGDKG